MHPFYVPRSPYKVIVSIIEKKKKINLMRNHTQLVVFFQTEFHRGKKFTCKKDFFFHPI